MNDQFKNWMIWHQISSLVGELLGSQDDDVRLHLLQSMVEQSSSSMIDVLDAIRYLERECNPSGVYH